MSKDKWFHAALTGDLKKQLESEQKHVRESMASAVKETTASAKAGIRAATVAAGLGRRLGNTWRHKDYPQNAAGFVYTTAGYILEGFLESITIKGKDGGKYIAIPTEYAPKKKGQKPTPGNYPGELQFVPAKGGRAAMLVDVRRVVQSEKGIKSFAARKLKSGNYGAGAMTVPIFILVKQVRTRKRIDLKSLTNKYQRELIERATRKINEPNR